MTPEIINIQVSDGIRIIPTATLVVRTLTGEEKKFTANSPEGETINHAILRALVESFGEIFVEQTITLMSCGYNLSRKINKDYVCEVYKAHVHIKINYNGDSQSYKRKGNHSNPNMAMAQAILNCLMSLALINYAKTISENEIILIQTWLSAYASLNSPSDVKVE